jgi:hypothetical protein
MPCPLLAEVHSTLIYNLRTVAFARHSAVLSLLRRKEQLESQGLEDDEFFGVDTDQLSAAVSDIGNNWERVPLRFSEGREGWEEALVGCLKDVSVKCPFISTLFDVFLLARNKRELPPHARNSYQIALCARPK